MDNPSHMKTTHPYKGWVSRSKAILAPILAILRARSVLDLGCNCGPWLGAAIDLGISPGSAWGVNDLEIWDNILFNRECSLVHDLAKPLDLKRSFDLVICLEVAEHVGGGDEGAAELMRTITRHGNNVLFSAATPGQPGDGHINCQPHEYWHERFAAYGYQCWDIMRPFIQGRADTEDWYKKNMFLYTLSPPPAMIMEAHQYLYYVRATPVLSDMEYDNFCKQHGLNGGGGSDMESSYSEGVRSYAQKLLANRID
jgi:SAM-dependent methyltransferase